MKFIKQAISLAVLLLITDVSGQVKETSQKFVDYFDWVLKEGGRFSKMELRKIAENFRGVYALEDIKKGEEMLYVPDHLVLSLEKSKESRLGKLMTEKRLVPGGYRLNSPTMSVMAVANLENEGAGLESSHYLHW
jgi:hypothetical protein